MRLCGRARSKGVGRGGGKEGGWQKMKPVYEDWYGVLKSLASLLEAVGGRLPTLLLATEQLYCKLIKQHFYVLVYKPDIANAQIPMDIFLARIFSNQAREGRVGLHIPKTSQLWHSTQPITLHHHMAELTEDLRRKKILLAEAKGHISKYFFLPLLSSTYTSSGPFYSVDICSSFQHLLLLASRTPHSPGYLPASGDAPSQSFLLFLNVGTPGFNLWAFSLLHSFPRCSHAILLL